MTSASSQRSSSGASSAPGPAPSWRSASRRAGGGWPWATFNVNLVGAFLLGHFVTRLQERLPVSAYRRPLLGTGQCSELRTFSTMLVELLRMLDRDRIVLALGYPIELPRAPEVDPSGLGVWQKLMIHSAEQAHSTDGPLHHQLVRALGRAGASGATRLRGIWGFQADQKRPVGTPSGSCAGEFPALTVLVDTPQRVRRWYRIVDELTGQTGLLTSEMVPAFRASGPGVAHGGLDLARLSDLE